ncbi:MAG: ATP-binding cassette domain-containing protein [Proteobacteria bacterium]|nr:ATP-binding cassette domain-containing protein [Pseudomonadota bacterium]
MDKLAAWLINVDRLPDNADKLPQTLWPFVWHFIRQIAGLCTVILLLEATLAGIGAFIPWMVGHIVDVVTSTATAPEALQQLKPLLWFGGLLILAQHTVVIMPLRFVYGYVLQPRFIQMIRRQTHWYVLQHSLAYFNSDFAGRIANKVAESVPALANALRSFTGAVWYVVVFATVALSLIGSTSGWLLIPVMCWLVCYISTLGYFVPKVARLSTVYSSDRSNLIGRIVDAYTNVLTVKLFARKKFEDGYTRDGINKAVGSATSANGLMTVMQVLLDALNLMLLTSVTAIALWQWYVGAISAGSVAMVLPLVVQMTGQSGWIMHEVTEIFEQLGRVQEGMDTVCKPHRVVDTANAQPLAVKQGNILFDKVGFHYGKDAGVIEGLDLHIKPGEKIGLVGRSGAGKSTIVNLLLRFYDLQSGAITIDGQDIATVTQDTLREQIAMVTQDTSLLHRSIRDNIRYGKPDATDEEIIAAAQKAHAHEFILDLEDPQGRTGYDAHVGERGVKLSGGQRQRIAIARVILKDAPILILDEATSALDSEVEAAIQESLATLMDGKTVIAIAHRLSTLNIMDRIVVLEKGIVAEDGTHADLLQQNGRYARLWQMQSGGFLPD